MTRFWRSLFALFFGLLLGGFSVYSFAGTVAYKFNGLNVVRSNGQTHFAGTVPAAPSAGVSGGPWYVGSGALHGSGNAIANGMNNSVFNSSAQFASTAAAVAVTAVKLNPGGLITSAVGGYLLGLGLEYAEGEWKKQTAPIAPTDAYLWQQCGVTCSDYVYSTPLNACLARAAGQVVGSCSSTDPLGCYDYYCNGSAGGHAKRRWNVAPIQTCPAGQTLSNGQCTGKTIATDSDWDAARTGMWPDDAMRDLVKNGVPLPTDKPVFNPTSKDIPLSDPAVDPVTQKRFRDMARVTPQPSNPDTADVTTFKQEVDANGQPVTQNGTPVPPEAADSDLCKKNPGIIACMQGDIPDAPDISNLDKTITITPDSGWGPDSGSCPADRVSTLHGGVQHVQSWQPTCQFLSMFRPALLAVAWFSAVLIAVGIYKTYS